MPKRVAIVSGLSHVNNRAVYVRHCRESYDHKERSTSTAVRSFFRWINITQRIRGQRRAGSIRLREFALVQSFLLKYYHRPEGVYWHSWWCACCPTHIREVSYTDTESKSIDWVKRLIDFWQVDMATWTLALNASSSCQSCDRFLGGEECQECQLAHSCKFVSLTNIWVVSATSWGYAMVVNSREVKIGVWTGELTNGTQLSRCATNSRWQMGSNDDGHCADGDLLLVQRMAAVWQW